jgi:hypothetical protein
MYGGHTTPHPSAYHALTLRMFLAHIRWVHLDQRIGQSQGLNLYTTIYCKHNNKVGSIQVPSEVRTKDPSVRAREDRKYLTQYDHSDHFLFNSQFAISNFLFVSLSKV